MANKTIPGLDAITAPDDTAVLWLTDTTTSPQDRKLTFTNLWNWVAGKTTILTVNTIADLRALTGRASLGVELLGYYAANDGGGGPLRVWVSGAAPGTYVDNGGSIIVPTGGDGSAAWLWEYSGPVNPKWVGVVADGVTDDTVLMEVLLDGTYPIVNLGGLSILVSGLEVAGDNVLVDGGNATLLSDAANTVDVLNVTGSGVTIMDLTVRSDTPGTRKARYGINVVGANTKIRNVDVYDITYTAVFNNSTGLRAFDIYAENCGWDCASNYVATVDAIWSRCIAKETGRHGFSTDTGAQDVTFEDCVAQDIGDIALNEPHDAFHFEGSIRSIVKDCIVRFTADNRLVTGAGTNAYSGLRIYAAVDSVVDGIDILVDAGFVPLAGPSSIQALVVDGALVNMRCTGYRFLNQSATSFAIYFGNTSLETFLEFTNFEIIGKFAFTQGGISSGVKKWSGGFIRGTGAEIGINIQYKANNVQFENITFESLAKGIECSGFIGTQIRNCVFKDCSSYGIECDWYAYSADYRPSGGEISGNAFYGTTGVAIKLKDGINYTLVKNNRFTGTITTLFEWSNATAFCEDNQTMGATITNLNVGSNFGGLVNAWGNNFPKIRTALTTPITFSGVDLVVLSKLTTPAAVAVSVSPTGLYTHWIYTIKDATGDAGANNITITPTSGTIDGAATKVINANYGFVRFVTDGTNFYTV